MANNSIDCLVEQADAYEAWEEMVMCPILGEVAHCRDKYNN